MTTLNTENAKTAKLVREIDHPENGTKCFNYNEEPLNDGEYMSSWGRGSNGSILPECEYHFWEVIK